MAFSRILHPITSVWLKEWRQQFPDIEPYYRIEGDECHGEPSSGEYVIPVVEQRK